MNAKDIQNKTALHYAIQEHRYVQLKLFRFLQIHLSKFIWNLIEISFIRLETTKLLLDAGADQFAKSKNGDDALQIACLKGAHDIFRHLIERIPYSKERLASANELIGEKNENVHVFLHWNIQVSTSTFSGSTYLDEHNETTLAVLHWKEAHEIRSKDSGYIGMHCITYL